MNAIVVATVVNAVAVVVLVFVTWYYARQTAHQARAASAQASASAEQAAAAARSVELLHRQWVASRRATVVPIEIGLRAALPVVDEMEKQLQSVIGAEGKGFGSVTLVGPSGLADALNGSRLISLEMFQAVREASDALHRAAEISNRGTGAYPPQQAWNDALPLVRNARINLERAIALAAADLQAASA